jgi:hypothetical protein
MRTRARQEVLLVGGALTSVDQRRAQERQQRVEVKPGIVLFLFGHHHRHLRCSPLSLRLLVFCCEVDKKLVVLLVRVNPTLIIEMMLH